MHTGNRIRQAVFAALIAGLIGCMGLGALPHRVDSATLGETTAELTPELTAQTERAATLRAKQTATQYALTLEAIKQRVPLRREILVGRAWMVARAAGKLDAESPADLDASLGVYTTMRAWHLFRGGGDERPPRPGTIGAERYHRPLFIMPITGSGFSGFKGFGGPPRPPDVVPECYATYVVILFADDGSYHGSSLIPKGRPIPDLTVLHDLERSDAPFDLLTQVAPKSTPQPRVLTQDVLAERAYLVAQRAGEVDTQTVEDTEESFSVYTSVNAWLGFMGEAKVPVDAPCTDEAETARRPLFVKVFTGSDFQPLAGEEAEATEVNYTTYIVALFADDGGFYSEWLVAEGDPLPYLKMLDPDFLYRNYGE